MREHALGTREPSYMPRPAKPFFIPEAHDPQRAMGHVAAPGPSRAGRRGPELRGTWQHRSPPEKGGEFQSCETRDSIGALPSRKLRSRAVWHAAVCLAPCLGLKPVCGVPYSHGTDSDILTKPLGRVKFLELHVKIDLIDANEHNKTYEGIVRK
jgi:hypothetical protein